MTTSKMERGKLVISVKSKEMPVIPPSMNLFGSKNPFKPKLAETIPMMISMTLLLSALIVTHFFL